MTFHSIGKFKTCACDVLNLSSLAAQTGSLWLHFVVSSVAQRVSEYRTFPWTLLTFMVIAIVWSFKVNQIFFIPYHNCRRFYVKSCQDMREEWMLQN